MKKIKENKNKIKFLNLIKNFKTKKGFTLIELIIVIIVIGILAAMAIPKFMGVERNSKVAAMQRDLDIIEKAVQQYVSNSVDGSYPFKDLNGDNLINEEDLYFKTNSAPQTLKDSLLNTNGDDGTEIYQLDMEKLKDYIEKLKYKDTEYLYSPKSETAIDPIGKIDGKENTHHIIGNGKSGNIVNLKNWEFINGTTNDIEYSIEELKDMPKGDIKFIDKNSSIITKEYIPSFKFYYLGKKIDTLKISNDGKINFLDIYREEDDNFISLIGNNQNNSDNFNFIPTTEYLTGDINVEIKETLTEIPLDSTFIFDNLIFNSIKIVGPNICLGDIDINTGKSNAYILGVQPTSYDQSINSKILYKKGVENNKKYIVVEFKDYFYLNYSFKLYEDGRIIFYFNDSIYQNFTILDARNNEMNPIFNEKVINNSTLSINKSKDNTITIGDVYIKEGVDSLVGIHYDDTLDIYVNGNYNSKYVLVEYRDVLYNDVEKSDFAIKIYEDGTYNIYFNNDKTFLKGKVINSYISNFSVFINTIKDGSGIIRYTHQFKI